MASETSRVVIWAGTGGIAASVLSWGERVVPGALTVPFVAEASGRSAGCGSLSVDWYFWCRIVTTCKADASRLVYIQEVCRRGQRDVEAWKA